MKKSPLQIVGIQRPKNNKKVVKEPQVYNMTPNVSEEEAKKVRDKFDRTYMKRSNPENLPEWTPQGSTVGPDPITKKLLA